MKLRNITSNYAVDMTVSQFLKFNAIDFLDAVQPAMVAAGAQDIEYNGHFGPSIFFTAEPSKAQAVMDAVRRLLSAKPPRAKSHPLQHLTLTP